MTLQARPIGFKPGRMKGLTPRLIASHYENNYGGALRRLNAIRGELAARHPSVGWIGVCEKIPERAKFVADKVGADFVTADYRELIARPEVNALVVSTDEHLHVDPVLAACERGIPMLIEKPLALTVADGTASSTDYYAELLREELDKTLRLEGLKLLDMTIEDTLDDTRPAAPDAPRSAAAASARHCSRASCCWAGIRRWRE